MKTLTGMIFIILFASCLKEKQIPEKKEIQNNVYDDVLPVFLAYNFLNIFPPPQNRQTQEFYDNGPIYILVNDSTENLDLDNKHAFIHDAETSFRPTKTWFKNGRKKVALKIKDSKFKIISSIELSKFDTNLKTFCGKIQFSNVAFDPKQKFAVFSISYRCCKDVICGNGYRIYTRYENSKWKIIKVIHTWVS